jgi:predicted DNA-binding protein
MATTQISAHIPEALKERMERHVRATGTTRANLVEQALEHHLQALDELPLDVIVPARIVLTRESAELVRDRVERPRKPTKAMRKLFDDR